jgi:hypothetical protein
MTLPGRLGVRRLEIVAACPDVQNVAVVWAKVAFKKDRKNIT